MRSSWIESHHTSPPGVQRGSRSSAALLRGSAPELGLPGARRGSRSLAAMLHGSSPEIGPLGVRDSLGHPAWDSRVRVQDAVIPPYRGPDRSPVEVLVFRPATRPRGSPGTFGLGRARPSLVEQLEHEIDASVDRRELTRQHLDTLLAADAAGAVEDWDGDANPHERRLEVVRLLVALLESGLAIVEGISLWRRKRPLHDEFERKGKLYPMALVPDLHLWHQLEAFVQAQPHRGTPSSSRPATPAADVQRSQGSQISESRSTRNSESVSAVPFLKLRLT
ncbi:hypothetical protein T492DRAFT_72543 [Pavlovales sp. CCMP2436]|nr:hypothetical protein T492DRAFT_72543 [Pavlovales sp. CCMP2436]